jgi:hypothetical protein
VESKQSDEKEDEGEDDSSDSDTEILFKKNLNTTQTSITTFNQETPV